MLQQHFLATRGHLIGFVHIPCPHDQGGHLALKHTPNQYPLFKLWQLVRREFTILQNFVKVKLHYFPTILKSKTIKLKRLLCCFMHPLRNVGAVEWILTIFVHVFTRFSQSNALQTLGKHALQSETMPATKEPEKSSYRPTFLQPADDFFSDSTFNIDGRRTVVD